MMAETTSKPRSSGMIVAYQILAIVTTLVIILQFFLAGLGAFHDFQTGKTDAFSAHEKVGYVIAVLGLVMLVVAALARLGARVIVMGAVMFLLAGPVQALLADAGKHHSDVWGALHALVGSLIVGLVFSMLRVGRGT
jgi:Family of unknown function (DUF6220)